MCPGTLAGKPQKPSHKEMMEDINVSGTENVLSACVEANVSRLIYTSSTTAYGFHPDNEVPLTEESSLRGNDDLIYSKNKKDFVKSVNKTG